MYHSTSVMVKIILIEMIFLWNLMIHQTIFVMLHYYNQKHQKALNVAWINIVLAKMKAFIKRNTKIEINQIYIVLI